MQGAPEIKVVGWECPKGSSSPGWVNYDLSSLQSIFVPSVSKERLFYILKGFFLFVCFAFLREEKEEEEKNLW